MIFSRSFSIEDPTDLAMCGVSALLLEVSAWPKPGNVHRTRDFPETKFEHFLIGDLALYEVFLDIAKGTDKGIGQCVFECVSRVSQWQHGGNVNLGQVLLLVPLISAAREMLHSKTPSLVTLRQILSEQISKAGSDDSANIIRAVQVAGAGGLREGAKFDVNDNHTLETIRIKNVSPRQLFKPSSTFDSISKEWISDFELTFSTCYPHLERNLLEHPNLNYCLVRTFLEILAEIPDSLIWRKSTESDAREVSKQASELLDLLQIPDGPPGADNRAFYEQVLEFDNRLQEFRGVRNPGTTADLLGASIFLALLFGLRV